MVTENGGIKSSTKYDKKFYSQIRMLLWQSILCICFGICVFAIGLTFYLRTHDAVLLTIVIGAALIAVGGLLMLIGTRVSVKKNIRMNISNEVEIFSDHYIVTSFTGGVKIGDAKVYFKTLYKCKESKDFFLMYINRAVVCPIGKECLTAAERIAVRKALGLPPQPESKPDRVITLSTGHIAETAKVEKDKEKHIDIDETTLSKRIQDNQED